MAINTDESAERNQSDGGSKPKGLEPKIYESGIKNKCFNSFIQEKSKVLFKHHKKSFPFLNQEGWKLGKFPIPEPVWEAKLVSIYINFDSKFKNLKIIFFKKNEF